MQSDKIHAHFELIRKMPVILSEAKNPVLFCPSEFQG